MMVADNKTTAIMLGKLLEQWVAVPANMDCGISGVTQDSRTVKPGDLFLACLGQTVNGVEYIDEAIEKGARAIIWQHDEGAKPIAMSVRRSKQGDNIPVIAIPDLANKAGLIAAQFYNHPSQHLFVTGFTGTNGKTSCSHFLAQALNEDETTGVIGTLGNGLYGELETATHTTPDAVTCQKWLAEMFSAGAKNIAMEVSSHALDQGRVTGVEFDCAVFTNLTRDHLDYHGDMESYLESKQKLFLCPTLKYAVINIDDASGPAIKAVTPGNVKVITYGLSNENDLADVYAKEIHLGRDGIKLHINTPWGKGEL
ncbi:MAG: Mur ligase family protein, partial [Thioalkalispiraceae bacterium]